MKTLLWLIAVLTAFSSAHAAPVEVGGQFRLRYENRTPTSFTNNLGNDFSLLRTRVHASGSPAEKTNLFIELQDSRTLGGSAVGANSSTS